MNLPETMRMAVLSLFASSLLLAACQNGTTSQNTPLGEPEFEKEGTLSFIRPDGTVIKTIDIEIAEDQRARQTGMMFRRKMTLEQGMLFLFDEPILFTKENNRGFWMKNTPIPLDIIFVAPDSQVVTIVKRTRPLSEETVHSTGPAQYVVEVRGGFSDRYGLTDSTRIRWQHITE